MDQTQLRDFVLSLPDAQEQETWGHPTFRVGGKIFASLPEPGVVMVKTTPTEQHEVLTQDSDAFTPAPRLGRFGWTTARLDRVEADQLRQLVRAAWHRTAPASVRDSTS